MLKSMLRSMVFAIVGLIAVALIASVISGMVMQHRFSARLAQLRAAGEPISSPELAPPEPARDDNAAELLSEAFGKLAEADNDEWLRLIEPFNQDRPPADKDVVAAEDFLRDRAAALALVRRASLRSRCRFAIPYDAEDPFQFDFEHLSGMRLAARLLNLSAAVHTARGKPDAAVNDCLGILRIVRANADEPFLASHLVRIAIEASGMERLERILNTAELSEAALRRIVAATDDDDRRALRRAFQAERCTGVTIFQGLCEGKAMVGFESGRAGAGARMVGSLSKAYHLNDALLFLEFIDESVRLADFPYHQAAAGHAESKLSFKARIGRMHPVSALLLPSADRVSAMHDRGVARRRLARTAAALRLFRLKNGKYPAVLTELVPDFLAAVPIDPFSGRPLRLRVDGKGFAVYVVSVSGFDNGGKRNEENPDAGDLVWTCSR